MISVIILVVFAVSACDDYWYAYECLRVLIDVMIICMRLDMHVLMI